MFEGAAQNFIEWLEGSSQPSPGFQKEKRHSQIPRVLAAGELRVVYQPLVELGRNRIFAYEALVRSTSPHWESPPALFSEAIRGQCCGALGRVIREIAIRGCSEMPLFLNIHPNEFDEGWLVQPDDPIFSHHNDVYIEITESVPLSHFALCHSVLSEIRHKGILLAVDDLGAGYSNLKYIADLAPEIVKIDRSLVANLANDARLHKLVSHIVGLCTDLGARVVAEGIERADEARAVVDTGAHYGQGFFFARPSFPPPDVSWESTRF